MKMLESNIQQLHATIVGAGDDANIEYTDFRDGGVFEPQVN